MILEGMIVFFVSLFIFYVSGNDLKIRNTVMGLFIIGYVTAVFIDSSAEYLKSGFVSWPI